MRRIPFHPVRSIVLMSAGLAAHPVDGLAGPIFTTAGGISAPGGTPGYSIDATGTAGFSAFASGGKADTTGNLTSGGTPSTAPTAHTLNLSCLPNGFPGGAPNVRNHAQLCIQGIANRYGNNGIYVNGVKQTGPMAYNDNDYMVTLGLDVQPGSNNPVGLYDVVQGESGAPQFWAVNSVTQLQPGFTSNAFGYELDMNNNSGNAANNNYGFWATGASGYPNFAAFNASGVGNSQWHFGYVSTQGVDTADLFSTSKAADSLNIQGTHPGSGLKLKAGLFGTSAIDLATDPASGAQTIRWSDQNNGGYGTFTIGVDKTTAADKATSLAINLPLGNVTMRYDGSLILASAATGGNLTMPGAATIGGEINSAGLISTGDIVLADTHAMTFNTNTGSACFFFHDDGVAGLVYQCGNTRLMRIPDNGSAPIFKTAPIAGTP